MIVYKTWYARPTPSRPYSVASHFSRVRWEGWFLLGFIPLYVRQVQYIEPQ